MSALQRLFQLTPAEARIAQGLANGMSLAEIAREQRAHLQTVRKQLKAVFAKTGTHRQAQCVAATEAVGVLRLKTEDVIEVRGRARLDERAKSGCEVEILEARVLNRSGQNLPFNAATDIELVGARRSRNTVPSRCEMNPRATYFAFRQLC